MYSWTFRESNDQVRDKSESKYQRVQDKSETIEKRLESGLESETGLEYYSPKSTAIAFREQPADSAGTVSPERLHERWWRHSCFTIGQIHHMTTITCFSNIFNSNTAHKSVFRTVKVFYYIVAMLYWVTFNKNTDKSKYTPTLLVFK